MSSVKTTSPPVLLEYTPTAQYMLQELGSTLECLHTHFLDTGDSCPLAGVDDPWDPATADVDGNDNANRGPDETPKGSKPIGR